MSNKYDPVAVDRAIASSNRAGRTINSREAKLIHALLRGRDPLTRAAIDTGKLVVIKA